MHKPNKGVNQSFIIIKTLHMFRLARLIYAFIWFVHLLVTVYNTKMHGELRLKLIT
jgi:hypothetical protein